MGWLTTIARRLAIDRTRSKQYKAHNRELSMEAETQGKSWDERLADYSSKITVNTQAREILDALGTLSDQYKEVITLSYYEGLPHSKISERLDIPLGTVKSRLREGVIQLRRLLDVKVAVKDGSQGSI